MSPGETPATPATPVAPPARRSRRWLTVLLCALIFLAGSVTGAGAMALHTRKRVLEAVRHPEVVPERIVSRLRRPLELDAQQELQIRAILARRQAALLEARAEALARAGPEFEGIETDIAAVLRPDQMDMWRKLYKKFLREWMPEKPIGRRDGRADDLSELGYTR